MDYVPGIFADLCGAFTLNDFTLSMNQYDVTVIGSGPGGYVAAILRPTWPQGPARQHRALYGKT